MTDADINFYFDPGNSQDRLVAQLDLRSTWLESPHGKDGQLQSSGNSCHELVVARLGVCGTPIFQ